VFFPQSLTIGTTHARSCGCAGCMNNEESRIVAENVNAADSAATTNSMDVGDTFNGTLDRGGDTDWIALDLGANHTVTISMLAAIIHEAPVLARGAMFEGPLLLDAHR